MGNLPPKSFIMWVTQDGWDKKEERERGGGGRGFSSLKVPVCSRVSGDLH